MKIAYILKRYPRFSETFIVNEILALEQQGVDIEIYTLMLPPEDEQRHENLALIKAPVFYLPNKSVVDNWNILLGNSEFQLQEANLKNFLDKNDENYFLNGEFIGKRNSSALHRSVQALTLAMLASNRGIEHFHAHFATDATVVAQLAGRLSGISYSFTAHAKDIYHTYVSIEEDKAMLQSKIREARFVVTVSDYNCDHLNRVMEGHCTDKIHRLYNGIDLSKFSPIDKTRHSKRILAVGRLVEKKGFKYLVDACAILKSMNLEFECLIVGDGPEQENLENQIKQLNLQEHVRLLGPQTQNTLQQTMADSAFMVLPCIITESGDRDGLPTVLLEAMARALPVISTQVAGVPEIIDDQQTGYLTPQKDPDAMAKAMANLLGDVNRIRRMGEQARLKAESHFDLNKNVATLKQYFIQCSASSDLAMNY